MKIENFETYLVPTTVAVDSTFTKFHPGIKHGLRIFYWSNRTFDSEDAALIAAEMAMNDAIAAANSVISQWNLESLT